MEQEKKQREEGSRGGGRGEGGGGGGQGQLKGVTGRKQNQHPGDQSSLAQEGRWNVCIPPLRLTP